MERFERLVQGVLITLAFCSALGGIGLFILCLGMQIYWFLKSGVWTPIGSLDGLGWIGFEDKWLSWPETWLGLHKLLNSINAGFGAFVIGLFVGGFFFKLYEDGVEQARPGSQSKN